MTTFTYNDPVDRPLAPADFRVFNRTTSANQQNLTYGYDNNGNITSISDSLFTGSRTFDYDDLHRLTSASGTFGTNQSQTSCSYAYNAIGDITDKCGTAFTYGDPMHPSAVTYNPATGKSYTYDANGNMLTRGNQTLTWDIDNRVSSVSISGGGTTTMEYDYSGIRVKKNAPAGTILYPFQGYEIEPSGTIVKFIRIGIESFASKRGTNKYFYHNDHLGGVNVITDLSGNRCQLNEYDPWGSVSRSDPTNPGCDPTHRFTGKELDPETGLYYYGGRYYDPEISRFISADPIVPQPGNPQALNRYSYTINNPQNFIDPSGHSFFGFLKKIFKVLTKYVLPAINPAFALQRAISLLPRPVAAGIGMALGVVTAVTTGDPSMVASGILGFASAAASLGKSNGWQYASLGLGIAATATSVYSIYSKHGFGTGGFGIEGNRAAKEFSFSGNLPQQGDTCLDCADVEWRAFVSRVSDERPSNPIIDQLIKNAGSLTSSGTVFGKAITEPRPYAFYTQFIQQIMAARLPIPDPGTVNLPGIAGALRWDVLGTFNGSLGTYQLVVDVQRKMIVHFQFVSFPK